jgi:DNA-binding NarL/FixJ family response regulator
VIRILLADDEQLVRTGLRMILRSAGDIEVVAEAAEGGEALALIRRHAIDVALMDVRMPGVDGLTAIRRLAGLPSPPRVIVLTTFDLDEYIFQALEAGAAGFLLKDTPPHELIQAVRVVAAGEAMLSPSVTRRLIGLFAGRSASRADAARRRLETLTGREREVLRLAARGCSNAEIGALLSASEATIKAHMSSILAKLEAGNRVKAAIIAHDAGLDDEGRPEARL